MFLSLYPISHVYIGCNGCPLPYIQNSLSLPSFSLYHLSLSPLSVSHNSISLSPYLSVSVSLAHKHKTRSMVLFLNSVPHIKRQTRFCVSPARKHKSSRQTISYSQTTKCLVLLDISYPRAKAIHAYTGLGFSSC